MKRQDWIGFCLSWILLIVLVNPIGEFPLNDDWGYAKVVKHLVDTGQYRAGDWPVMSLFSQVIWGAAFAKIFGFSFSILRISTLVLAIFGTYWIFLESLRLSNDLIWTRVAVLTLLLSPLYFHLSFTFMTDVPFTVAVLAAVLLYKRAIADHSTRYWIGATIVASVATLIRQPALLLPLAFGLVWILQKTHWKRVLWSIGSLGFVYGVLLLYVKYIGEQGETPGELDSLMPLVRRLRPAFVWHQLQTRGGLIAFNLAAFLLPLICLMLPSILRRGQLRKRLAFASLAGCLTVFFAYQSWSGVPMGNIIDFFGLGPTTLKGIDQRSWVSPLPANFWSLLKILGYLSLFLLFNQVLWVGQTVKSWKRCTTRHYWKIGLVLFVFGYGLYLLVDYNRFDRYQLVLLPIVILLLSNQQRRHYPKWAVFLSLLVLLIMGSFSVGGTKDYLNWNRTRWAILDHLINEEGITPKQIDGGLEFNGWYATASQNPFSKFGKSWWFVAEDQYVLSFSAEMNCSEVCTAYPIVRWWPGQDTLYLHKRAKVLKRDTIWCDLEQLSLDGTSFASNLSDYSVKGINNRSILRAHSGQHSLLLTPARPYAGNIKLEGINPCDQLTISVWRWGGKRSAGIVVAAPGGNGFHTFQEVFTDQEEASGWHRVRQEVRIPANYLDTSLDIYLWNPTKDSIWMDDLEVIWKKVEGQR